MPRDYKVSNFVGTLNIRYAMYLRASVRKHWNDSIDMIMVDGIIVNAS